MPLPLRRIGRLTIDELCAAYRNEDVHTEHVMALALRLFDHTRAALDLPASGRHLLEAAARLHDVGYSVDPVHHMRTSAKIVLKEGIKGFTKSERDQVAQIIRRHSGNVSLTGAPKRVLQLAAFLRIADGLDYSHAQTAKIAGIRRTKQTLIVAVRSDAFPHWLTRVERKADLWRAVFPYDIQFVAAPAAKDGRNPLIRPDTPVIEAARRLLWIQFKTILANVDGAVAGETSEPVHDIRVAVRRMRTLLRVFRKYMPDVPRKDIEELLAEIGEELGPVRDLDEWVNLLESASIRAAVESSRLVPEYLRYHERQRHLVYARVRRCLRGRHFASQRLKINRLLREELPRLIKTESPGSLPKLATKQLNKAMRQVVKDEHLRYSRSPRKLHKLRITLRKARYLAEFFGSLLGPKTVRLAKRLHGVERVLGRIHDIDLGMEQLTREGPVPPRAIAVYLEQQRELNLAALAKEWRRFEGAGKR
jgi:exopolyphosphatase/guanosine-5'-triphosphate,3'-diphosphate pyrophosphatase